MGDLATDTPRGLPRGRHAASREVVADSQKSRLIAAMTKVAAEKGYARTTVVDVVSEAGVAKPTFYEHFADKQACLIAAYDAAIEQMMLAASAALSSEGQSAERIENGVTALLEFVAGSEPQARIILIEIVGAGPAAVAHMKATHAMLADTYVALREEVRKTWPDYPPLTRLQGLAVVGAITEPISAVLINDGAAAVRALTPEIVAVVTSLSLPQ
ncbi:MAG: TetR/AcrR family transcriptional regulator [Solirubrobacterales bacterium]